MELTTSAQTLDDSPLLTRTCGKFHSYRKIVFLLLTRDVPGVKHLSHLLTITFKKEGGHVRL